MKLRGWGHLHAEGNLSVYFGEDALLLAERLTEDRARDGRPGRLVEVDATVRIVGAGDSER